MGEKINETQRELLSAFLDGELDRKQADAVDARIRKDPEIRQELDVMRRTWDLLDHLPRSKPSPDFSSRTVELLAAVLPRPEPGPVRRSGVWWYRAAWAAAVAATLVIGYQVGYRIGGPEQPIASERRHVFDPIEDRHTIERLRQLEAVDDMEMLHLLAHPLGLSVQ